MGTKLMHEGDDVSPHDGGSGLSGRNGRGPDIENGQGRNGRGQGGPGQNGRGQGGRRQNGRIGPVGPHQHQAGLEAAGRRHGLCTPQVAYVLATAWHETRMGRWMLRGDTGWGDEFSSALGNEERGDGNRFRPRGYVGLRGRRQYTLWQDRLQVPLLDWPDLALDPDLAAEIAVVGMLEGLLTGHRLDAYIDEQRRDFAAARRVVRLPGKAAERQRDQAPRVARYAREFERLLSSS